MSVLARRAEAFARHAWREFAASVDAAPCEQHTARVVAILRSIGARDELVAAAYLISLVSTMPFTQRDIEQEFGPAIAALVRSAEAARQTDAIGAGRFAFEGGDAQTLVLAGDLATLRGTATATTQMSAAMLDEIASRVARLNRAHLYLQYEVCRELAWWRRCPTGQGASRL